MFVFTVYQGLENPWNQVANMAEKKMTAPYYFVFGFRLGSHCCILFFSDFQCDYVVLLGRNFDKFCIFYGIEIALELHQSSTGTFSRNHTILSCIDVNGHH